MKGAKNWSRPSNEGVKTIKSTLGIAPRNPRKNKAGKSRTSYWWSVENSW